MISASTGSDMRFTYPGPATRSHRWMPLVLLGFFLCGLPADTLAESPRNDSLQAILEGYRSLAVGTECVPIRDRNLKLGDMDVTLTKGRLYPVTTHAGVSAGFLFEGEGKFIYRADDPAQRRLLESSLSRR